MNCIAALCLISIIKWKLIKFTLAILIIILSRVRPGHISHPNQKKYARNVIYHEANEVLMNIILHWDIIFMAIKLIYLPILIIVIKKSHYCHVKWVDLIWKMY